MATATAEESKKNKTKALQRSSGTKLAVQLILLAALLLSWQFLPMIDWLSDRSRFLDPFFVSSPSAVGQTLFNFATGSNGRPFIWPYLWDTVSAALIATVVGSLLGALVGLVLSNNSWLYGVLRPFLVALNAIPRIAIIPIFVITLGPNKTASIVTAITVVFFVVFFNALEGGRSVPTEVVHNVRLLGGTNAQIMYKVRTPYVLAWTVTALPNAVSFGLLMVVTAEVMTGTTGMGRLLTDSVATLQPDLTFAVVVSLSTVGIALVSLTDFLRRRWLHWWIQEG